MREYKFRGQCVPDSKHAGEWVEGSIVACDDGSALIVQALNDHNTMTYHVNPETVGQFTGLLDKNGKGIFEGDILSNNRQFSEIVFDEEKAAFKVKIIGGSKGWIKGSVIDIHLFQSDYDINIIGNIHDNPELLKKEEK